MCLSLNPNPTGNFLCPRCREAKVWINKFGDLEVCDRCKTISEFGSLENFQRFCDSIMYNNLS